MAKTKNIKGSLFQELAAKYAEKIGEYDPEKQELKTPAGDVLGLELGRVGRSEPVYLKGDILEYLKSLNLPELQEDAEGKSGGMDSGGSPVSLSMIPARQVNSSRSWKAWFKVNYHADPETICAAVKKGFVDAEADMEKAREAEEKARQKAAEAEAVELLKSLKDWIGPERLAELMKEV